MIYQTSFILLDATKSWSIDIPTGLQRYLGMRSCMTGGMPVVAPDGSSLLCCWEAVDWGRLFCFGTSVLSRLVMILFSLFQSIFSRFMKKLFTVSSSPSEAKGALTFSSHGPIYLAAIVLMAGKIIEEWNTIWNSPQTQTRSKRVAYRMMFVNTFKYIHITSYNLIPYLVTWYIIWLYR